MQSHFVKMNLKTFFCITLVLLLGAGMALAQQQVNLTAGASTLTLPDGSSVPMWGYTCAGSTAITSSTATCAPLNPDNATKGQWSPVIITLPSGSDLQINLTNSLSFVTSGVPTNIPTSLTIVGQLGGGLGTTATSTPSPQHISQPSSWPIAATGPEFNPPPQGPRVQSFSTEVAAGATTSLTWTAPRPGTYLLESGTHPSIQGPMGLYGIVVVTSAPTADTSTPPVETAGTAYPGVTYNADLALLLSEIDAAQNRAVNTAVNTPGFVEAAIYAMNLKAGPVVSLNLFNPGSGYGAAPTVAIAAPPCVINTTTCIQATATADIDTDSTSSTFGQVTGLTITNGGNGYTSDPAVTITGNAQAQASLALGTSLAACSGGAPACYPPAVNYSPTYYLINGQAFDKTNAANSLFKVSAPTGVTSVSGNVLVRLVNAGLRMHVPSIVGSLTGTSAVPGLQLIAEDGNVLPGVPRVQNEVFMAAGKTYDVMINAPAAGGTALPIFDRQLSLSGNSFGRDAGMFAYIGVNGNGVPTGVAALAGAKANPDTYKIVCPTSSVCNKLTISDVGHGVVANDFNIYGVRVTTAPGHGLLSLNADGTFTFSATAPFPSGGDSFVYCGNGASTPNACATVLLTLCTTASGCLEGAAGISVPNSAYTANTSKYLAIKTPGVLMGAVDTAGYPLTVDTTTVTVPSGSTLSVVPDVNGGFAASVPGPGVYTFTFKAKNSQGTQSGTATVTLTFPAGNGPTVTVLDGADHVSQITDYRWVIEEDRTFFVDPNCTANPLPAGCPTIASGNGTPVVFGTNFHTSHMPLVATGCTGPRSCESGQTMGGNAVVCDVGNGACREDSTGTGQTPVDPSQVQLDPNKRYYISILPGDAADPFNAGYAGAPDCSTAGKAAGSCGHGMGGAPIAKGQTSVTVLTVPSPYPPAKLTVFVFQDDWPLNGEHDAGGGLDVLAPQEAGLGGFQITLFDDAGGTGDATGQPTYDMFNMPLTNSLAGTIDPVTNLDACPISPVVTANTTTGDGSQAGIVGMIVTCPKFESDGTTLSPLAGQAVVNNLYQGRYGVVATPNADRIGAGEEWLQTNTLDGQKAHDSFMRIGEPAYFQEFGPAGYHVTIGFANPKIINDRLPGVCAGLPSTSSCTNEVKGLVTTARMSRTPDERLYGSGTRDAYSFTQCYASLGDPDGAEFAFTKCDSDGKFDFTGIPSGNWKLTVFDQWNDQVVDGISMPIGLAGQNNAIADLGEIAAHQWQSNIYTRSFIDTNGDGVSTKDQTGVACTSTNPNVPTGCNPNFGNDVEGGLALVATNIRFRDGSFSNFNNTDLNGYAGFNEVFPLFNWYTIETDSTRYKTTGVHVVYDAGGPTDGTTACGPTNGNRPCGNSTLAANFANTYEANGLPANLSVPGAVYCAEGADCATSAASFAAGTPVPSSTSNTSTGRIDPPFWFGSYGWQGFAGQNSFLEFGKKPFVAGETGGIRGHVVYASTRPFDDPQLLLQLSWEPLVPHVQVNLYKEGVAADGTPSLTLIDHTETSSFDDWAQGFRSDGIPNMNCPGQSATDPFFFGLKDQPNYLDFYNHVLHGTGGVTALPNDSQYKCYDGMHNWNQLQPAPYDGMYSFPSVTSLDPHSGKPTGTNCTACTTNPDSKDPYRSGTPMLPAGKYVVEVVVPPGYELVKEEDKNILIGDNYIAPVTSQFAGLGNIFILPDQAEIGSACTAGSAAQNLTCSQGRSSNLPSHEGDTGSVESFWPCVGEQRTVPDFISLFPGSAEIAPFAGAVRNLCDRKEVTLEDQSSALAKFYIFTSTHIASHYTGVITDDFTAEFDPFSPQFGEKFAPAYLPVSLKDWTGNEISRTLADEFGAYNGLSYSTWEVNPPNPTGYGPTMMVTCMNDRGSDAAPDPNFQPGYSQFCYELPFMPGQTGYFDTPVVPTSAFAGAGYNNPDCSYPDATPAVSSVSGSDGVAGPWLSAAGAGHTLTINALGDQVVTNNAYSGPAASTGPFNQRTVTRHYGFGATMGTVAIGGFLIPAANITTWNDTSIQLTIPSANTIPACAVQQQAINGGSAAQCGQLLITGANGKQSVDTVTVTIGGKKPTVLAAGQTIQNAIDTAKPGDMIIVPAGKYSELLLMWKPVRLQGVGAASSVIDANTQPAGKLDPWRKQVVCLFGLTLDGRPSNAPYPGCDHSKDWPGFSGGPEFPTIIVDRVPMEGILGWDTSVNGNLAEQLIEPSLMGAYEGAAITVLGKGVKIPAGSPDPYGQGTTESAFPANTTLLTTANCNGSYPTNFYCNPSSIDGLSLINSSQGGGGIFVHAWGHNIQIANNRIHNNTGTLSGGITVGQGEHIDVNLAGDTAPVPPGSCESSNVTNLLLPFCYNYKVNVHNNAVTLNSSIGDELFSSTPAGAGGVSLCNGADYYNFNYNWVCGNLSSGDGGGVAHIGFSKNGTISHNTILFNQSTNPTVATNGGGLLIMGAPDPDPVCGETADKDCVADPSTITPSDGTGPGLVIDANLILGNSADSGSGGGLRLQDINGTDVLNFPHAASGSNSDPLAGHCNTANLSGCRWNTVTITNNIIANNVAGWDGAGMAFQDALAVNVINNTIVSNDSTASSGVLFQTLFAPLASSQGSNCTLNASQSCPQVAGLASITNGAVLLANLPVGVTCPTNQGNSGSCKKYSAPYIANNVIWKNRSFFIGVTAPNATGTTGQQSTVALLNAFTATAVPSQPTTDGTTADGNGVIITGGTGACTTNASYWEIGVRGDTGPSNHNGGLLSPVYSLLTDASDYTAAGSNNLGSDPTLVSQYCNGSRIPPEFATSPFLVIPGTNETNALPTPVFSLAPAATVDEGNNWVNMIWGPISLTHPITGLPLANYAPASGSPAIDYIQSSASSYGVAPALDFFGNPRKTASNPSVDAGAVEIQGLVHPVLSSISPIAGFRGDSYNVTLTGTGLTGTTAINGATGITVTGITVVDDAHVTASFAISATATTGARNITVTTPNGTSNSVTFTVQNPSRPTVVSVNPTSAVRGTSVTVTVNGTNFTTTGMTITFTTGTGITASAINVASPTQLTATFTIANTAGLGAGHTFRVNNPGGNGTNTLPFTVLGATLTLSAPVPPLCTNTGGTGGCSVGAANTTAKTGTVTVSNAAGATAPFTFSAAPTVVQTAGAANGSFSVTGGTCNSTTVLNPGANCTVVVHYTPTTTGTATAHVAVTGTGGATATVNSSNFNGN
jgi:hypothetical protein